MDQSYWIKKLRVLTLTLIFSGILNIGLVAALMTLLFTEDRSMVISGTPPQLPVLNFEENSSNSWIAELPQTSYRELLTLLTSQEPLEEGFAKRDFALGILTSFHDFDLERALGGVQIQRRTCSLGKTASFELFPGLTEEQFVAIIRFAHSEQWPFTPKGLFTRLKVSESYERSLVEAFAVTPIFRSYRLLFPNVETQEIIALICSGDWSFAQKQAQQCDLSDDRKRAIIHHYLSLNSSQAAELFLQMDLSFALKKLDDQTVMQILQIHPGKSPTLQQFCLALLQSLRSDMVRQKSAELLYCMTNEPIPTPFQYEEALRRFTQQPQIQISSKIAPPIKEQPTHTVREGETLWKIARQHQVRVKDLIALNRLEGERIYPGMTLKVPFAE